METPILDDEIKILERLVLFRKLTNREKKQLAEYRDIKQALSKSSVGQSLLCTCSDTEGHSVNKNWCYECDKPTK